jgi:ABC-type dipeptide/oligopeptide/nickel transport system permease component
MTKKPTELPHGIREFLSSTMKLMLLATIAAFSCGAAYGWIVGAKTWASLTLIVLIGQCWASRKDIADPFKQG